MGEGGTLSSIMDGFWPDPVPLNVLQFKYYMDHEQYNFAAKIILFNPETAILVGRKDLFTFLININADSVIAAIVFTQLRFRRNVYEFYTVSDFVYACQRCSWLMIYALSSHANLEFTPTTQEDSYLSYILLRDDPVLLSQVLEHIPAFVQAELEFPLYPYLFALTHDLHNLVAHSTLFIRYFDLSPDDLELAIFQYQHKYHDNNVPFALKVHSIIKRNTQICSLSEIRMSAMIKPLELNDVANVYCIDANSTLSQADELRKKLKRRNQGIYHVKQMFDPTDISILLTLPTMLLQDAQFMISKKPYLEFPLVGEDAVGEGPIQDLINKYYKQLWNEKIYFTADDVTTSILPTEGQNMTEEQIFEATRVFYGLGVVFLKTLIDMRSSFYGDTGKSNMEYSLHPWIFQALLGKSETDPAQLYYQCLLFDHKFGDVANMIRSGKTDSDRNVTNYIVNNKLQVGKRPLFLNALYQGFNLIFVPGITPIQLLKPMEKSRNNLMNLFKEFKSVSPSALQLLLTGPPVISFSRLWTSFDFKPYDYLSGESADDVAKSLQAPEDRRRFEQTKESVKSCFAKWCDEEGQVFLRKFLKYLLGVPTISPLLQKKWHFAVNFNEEQRSNVLWSFACDQQIRISVVDSPEEFQAVVKRTMDNFDGCSYDMQ